VSLWIEFSQSLPGCRL